MTDLAYLDAGATPCRQTVSWIMALHVGAAGAGGVGLMVAMSAPPATALEWQLVLLLRFMAVVKATMGLGALGLTHWRLRQPIGPGWAAGYVAALAPMLVAPGLIWSLAHVALGAALFHAGLLAFLILAWQDDAADKLGPRMGRT